MAELHEQVDQFVKRVKEFADAVKGNEQATKQALIGPFFTMLGYDLADPRECIPEHKVDFGRPGHSTKPIDWAFKVSGAFAFFVEAKAAGGKIANYDEQLADYFAKDPNVKLGILTNGVQWRFFTDVVASNIMDKEPFARWDVLKDPPPMDVIKLLAKAGFSAADIHTFAGKRHTKNLLVAELARLLEPAPEFTKLVIENVETRKHTENIVESWKPIVASALNEWAAQRLLAEKLAAPEANEDTKAETATEHLEAFAAVQKLLGKLRPIAYEDSVAYFKLHLAERRTWIFARLMLDRKRPAVQVPLAPDTLGELAGGRAVVANQGWSMITLQNREDVANIGPLLVAAYEHVKQGRTGVAEAQTDD